MYISSSVHPVGVGLSFDEIPFDDCAFSSVALPSDPSWEILSGQVVAEAVAPVVGKRRRRYEMLRAAASLLGQESVAMCLKHPSGSGQDAKTGLSYACVYKGARGAFLGHVTTCSSVWMCPHCVARISERRRADVAAVLQGHRAAGNQSWLSTFTIPHGRFSDPKELREVLAKSFNLLTKGRPFRNWKERTGFVGSIKALEVTHGGNGWHPHLHVVWCLDCHPRDAWAFGRWLFARWRKIIADSGQGDCAEAAWYFDVAGVSEAGDYVAKWGTDWEMTKGHLKAARSEKGSSRTPWQILADYTFDGFPPDGDLFKQYALAFKGARQLTWSKGLREAYGVGVASDDEVCRSLEDDEAKPECALQREGLVLLHQRRQVPAFLEAVERDGYHGALDFMWYQGLVQYLRPAHKVLDGRFTNPGQMTAFCRSGANRRRAKPVEEHSDWDELSEREGDFSFDLM